MTLTKILFIRYYLYSYSVQQVKNEKHIIDYFESIISFAIDDCLAR